MGMLVKGAWRDHDDVTENGAYVRPHSAVRYDPSSRTEREIAAGPGRYWLIASASCPWSHRTTLVRSLKRMRDMVELHMAHGPRLEGYALNGGRDWTIPGTTFMARHLHQLYTLHDTAFTGRVTVPVLWDSETKTIVSNESADIVRILDAVPQPDDDFTLRPDALAGEIDSMNGEIYEGLNNAVYRAGFAQNQSAYDCAVRRVFETLDRLERHLAASRFCFGNRLTETDIRLFPTLVRFDAIYAVLFKCCLRRLTDYPGLWDYARDLFALPGVADTVDFEQMRAASYMADTDAVHPIVAITPDTDWSAPHDRHRLGPVTVCGRNGEDFHLVQAPPGETP